MRPAQRTALLSIAVAIATFSATAQVYRSANPHFHADWAELSGEMLTLRTRAAKLDAAMMGDESSISTNLYYFEEIVSGLAYTMEIDRARQVNLDTRTTRKRKQAKQDIQEEYIKPAKIFVELGEAYYKARTEAQRMQAIGGNNPAMAAQITRNEREISSLRGRLSDANAERMTAESATAMELHRLRSEIDRLD